MSKKITFTPEQIDKVTRLFIEHFHHVEHELELLNKKVLEFLSEVMSQILSDILKLGGGK